MPTLSGYTPTALSTTGKDVSVIRHPTDSAELFCVFQPIADLSQAQVFAHEALFRDPANPAVHQQYAPVHLAHTQALTPAFEVQRAVSALKQWGEARHPGRLFIHISAHALVHADSPTAIESISQALALHHVKPRKVVLELTGHESVAETVRLREVAQQLHSQGMQIALSDFGDGRSSLRLWSEVKPDYVKIDPCFTRNISRSPEQLQVVQALREIANILGSALIATGIETADDLRVLRDLGLRFGQGDLLGLPHGEPQHVLLPQACDVVTGRRVAVMPKLHHPARASVMRNLSVTAAPVIAPDTDNDHVAELFHEYPELHALAVIDQGHPVALLNRQVFMNHYSTMYFREVFGRRPAMDHANPHPRLIERDFNVDELVGILTSQDQRYLTDGFIVTDNGRYVGLGTGDQLVRAVTEARIESARHANPLTFLPGNIPITQHIERLLATRSTFVAAYADLNHFKPFNDHYGYWQGDEMIRLVARIITQQSEPQCDFVGHVGGDDFIILFQSPDWEDRCKRIVTLFAEGALMLFDEPARKDGGIHAEDRHGIQRFFPCTTVSIGAVSVVPDAYQHAEDVANEAALAKHDAKKSATGISLRH